MSTKKMVKAYRQGDVLIFIDQKIPRGTKKLAHLTLAEGEVTGHAHRITEGEATLYERKGTLYLKVISDVAALTHEEHHRIDLPRGDYEIRIQREYEPDGWRNVID